MAMSYGAAFISTSAIVGFGGIRPFGLGLLWLPFMNIASECWWRSDSAGGRGGSDSSGCQYVPEFIGLRFQSTTSRC